ncbi:MAG: hypothetical protein IPQ21_19975 [Betaproteobacteria bacterium]|nr:hypothetical protein [Betaproteobacteria bacterium]
MNVLRQGRGMSAMFDVGDGLVGPREYDWLGPLCFLAAGDAGRIDAFFDGCDGRPDPAVTRAPAPALTPVRSDSGSRIHAGASRRAVRHRRRESRTARRTLPD